MEGYTFDRKAFTGKLIFSDEGIPIQRKSYYALGLWFIRVSA